MSTNTLVLLVVVAVAGFAIYQAAAAKAEPQKKDAPASGVNVGFTFSKLGN